jgi:bisanhydrobacterioruberin hydratase
MPDFYFLKKEKEVRKFFIIFYVIGVLGVTIPPTRNLFIYLTPFALLISFSTVIFFHQEGFDTKTISVFIFILVISYFIEVTGVKTGLIFGNYSYGKGLGPKLLATPLMIGINWLLLVYCTSVIFDRLPVHAIFKIFFPSLLMVIYDLIMEQVAPHLEMWYFDGDTVPLRNYISWFFTAFSLHSLIKLTGIKTTNKLAPLIFCCQLSFFGILFLYFTLME